VQEWEAAVSQHERFCSTGWPQKHGSTVPVFTSTASDVIAATKSRPAFITVILTSAPVAGKCERYKEGVSPSFSAGCWVLRSITQRRASDASKFACSRAQNSESAEGRSTPPGMSRPVERAPPHNRTTANIAWGEGGWGAGGGNLGVLLVPAPRTPPADHDSRAARSRRVALAADCRDCLSRSAVAGKTLYRKINATLPSWVLRSAAGNASNTAT
jgi:hypothetical protein